MELFGAIPQHTHILFSEESSGRVMRISALLFYQLEMFMPRVFGLHKSGLSREQDLINCVVVSAGPPGFATLTMTRHGAFPNMKVILDYQAWVEMQDLAKKAWGVTRA